MPRVPIIAQGLLAALLLVTLLAKAGRAQNAPAQPRAADLLESFESGITEIIAKCEPSVVSITRYPIPLSQLPGRAADGVRNPLGIAKGPRPPLPGGLARLQLPLATLVAKEPSGAGVVIDSEAGLVLTQYAVVGKDDSHLVTDVTGSRFTAAILAADPRSGLAVLQLRSRFPKTEDASPIRLPALPIGQAERLGKGRIIVTLGNPFSIESDGQPTASWGSITNTARKAPPGTDLAGQAPDGAYRTTLHHHGSLIQTDAKLGWNASGGAVVNLAGELIGVTTSVATIAGHESPAGYAIPLNKAMRRAVADLRRGRVPEYGFLGISGFSPYQSPTTGVQGVRIGQALRGGPAYQSGLRGGELLTHIGDTPIRSNSALQLTVSSLPSSASVPVRYEVAGQAQETTVSLGKAYIDPEGEVETQPRYPFWRGIRVDYATATRELQFAATDGRIDPEGCVVVSEVADQSVSWQQGVRPNVYISHVGERRVTTPAEFYEAVRVGEEDGGQNVKLKFTRPLPAAAKPAS